MKRILFAAALLIPLPAFAQALTPPTKLFTAGADIPALIAKAKAEQKSPAVNSIQQIAVLAPYRVQLEYRSGLTPPTVHHGESELVYVIQGNATLVTGGKLIGGGPRGPGPAAHGAPATEGAGPPERAGGEDGRGPAPPPPPRPEGKG